MKRIQLIFRFFITILIIQFGSACSKCKKGSGNSISIERHVPYFTGIETNGSFDVHITKDAVQKVIIKADDNIIPIIETEVENGILEIELDDDACLRRANKVDVYISTPSLRKVRLNGSGSVHGEGVFTDDEMNLFVNGSGDMFLNFDGKNLRSKIEGSGKITLSGSAENANHDINGSGNIQAKTLETQHVTTRVNGSGRISVNAVQTLKVNISGSGRVGYTGNPVTDVNINGSGKVVRE
jgi:hypothetical protein